MKIIYLLFILSLLLPEISHASWKGKVIKVNNAQSYVILKDGRPTTVKLENITFPEDTSAESYAKATLDACNLALSRTATVFEDGTTQEGEVIANVIINGRCLNDLLVTQKIMKVNDAGSMHINKFKYSRTPVYVERLPQKITTASSNVETVKLRYVSNISPATEPKSSTTEYYIEVEEKDPSSALGFWNNRKRKIKRLVKVHRANNGIPPETVQGKKQIITSPEKYHPQDNQRDFAADNYVNSPAYQSKTSAQTDNLALVSENSRDSSTKKSDCQGTKYRMDVILGYNAGGLDFDADGVSGYAGTGSGLLTGINFWEDGFLADWFTTGLLLRYRQQSSNVKIDGYGEGDFTLDAYDFIGRLTIRKNKGDIHPYAGFGFGASYFVESEITSESASGPTIEGFAGVDYDITDSLYLGMEADYTRSWFELYGVDFSHDGVGAALKLGFRFN
ncbi:porin family protein [Maridesulfovibrio bastinii]|uniref:porin family protein n=1 Tax=Maridesulfovibrio bastinii TaxID=47157 RepID=UPI000423C1A1|nr:porin family protein [Maridesulfovibrio bastinii]